MLMFVRGAASRTVNRAIIHALIIIIFLIYCLDLYLNPSPHPARCLSRYPKQNPDSSVQGFRQKRTKGLRSSTLQRPLPFPVQFSALSSHGSTYVIALSESPMPAVVGSTPQPLWSQLRAAELAPYRLRNRPMKLQPPAVIGQFPPPAPGKTAPGSASNRKQGDDASPGGNGGTVPGFRCGMRMNSGSI